MPEVNILEDVLNPNSIFDYDIETNPYTYDLEKFFTPVTIQGKTYEFTQDERSQIMASRYTVHNAPTDLISRENYKTSFAKLPYTKIGMTLDEDDLMALATPQTDLAFNQAVTKMYDDSARILRAIREKREIQRAEVLFTGKIDINENNYIQSFDFGIPEENRKEFNWQSDAKIYEDIYNVTSQLKNNGQNVAPSFMIARPKLIDKILMDEKIRAMLSTYNVLNVPTIQDLNNWLVRHNLPQFISYNRVAVFPDETMSHGESKALLDENKIVFIPNGSLGNFVNGTTPEEAHALVKGLPGGVQMSRQDDIVLQTFGKADPEEEILKASARFFTTISVPKQIAIATVTLPS